MSNAEHDPTAVEEPFSLTVDQYGRLWLHTKLDGLPIAIDLAEKNTAFEIMAAKMAEFDFEHQPMLPREAADNDDQVER